MLLWPTFFTPTEMLPVARVAVDWEREAVLAPFYSLTSLYKHAKARHRLPVTVRQILLKYEMKRMTLAIFVQNLEGIHQPILKLSNRESPRPLPCFGHSEWQEKTAENSGGSGSTTWQIRRKYLPEKLASCGVPSGERFGLAHFLSRSYYFALFSEVTWHLGHVIDVKHSL